MYRHSFPRLVSIFLFLLLSGFGCIPVRTSISRTPAEPVVDEQQPPEIPTPEIVPTLPEGPIAPAPVLKDEKLPQFVLLAFDGSQSIQMWKDTRAFASEETAKGSSVHFTYFINAAYLLTPQTRNQYFPPQHPAGTSAIKFGFNQKDVANRIEQMNLAMKEGHEIGSHAVGHWDGRIWSQEEWTRELTQFNSITASLDEINGLSKAFPTDPIERRVLQLPTYGFAGFRAPDLGVSAGLWPTLKALGYRYDTSTVGHPNAWPTKNAVGLWSFPLAFVPYDGTKKKIIAMDYNFYFKHTKAVDDPTIKKGTPQWQTLHDETLKTYTDYFESNYNETRAPVQIGHHFSLWNDGVYWEVLKDFADLECGKPDVRCVTFSELADWLDAHTKEIPETKKTESKITH